MMAFGTFIVLFGCKGAASVDVSEREYSEGILSAARDDTTAALFLEEFIIAVSKMAY